LKVENFVSAGSSRGKTKNRSLCDSPSSVGISKKAIRAPQWGRTAELLRQRGATHVEAASWDEIIEESGLSRAELNAAAEMYANSKKTICAWCLGVTQQRNGVDNGLEQSRRANLEFDRQIVRHSSRTLRRRTSIVRSLCRYCSLGLSPIELMEA
jgi:hypothetical protein